MTNFDFLKNTPAFDSFADVAISAEKLLHIDVDACVLNCRRSMEFAIWTQLFPTQQEYEVIDDSKAVWTQRYLWAL